MKIKQDYWTFLLFPQTLNHHLKINTDAATPKDIWTLNSLSFLLLHCICISVLFTGEKVCVFVCVSVNSRGRSSENDSVSAAARNSNPLICSSESPASQLSRSLWHPRRPLAPCPCPLKIATRGNWKLFSKKDKRWVKDKDGAGKRDAGSERIQVNGFVRHIDPDCDGPKGEIYVDKTPNESDVKTLMSKECKAWARALSVSTTNESGPLTSHPARLWRTPREWGSPTVQSASTFSSLYPRDNVGVCQSAGVPEELLRSSPDSHSFTEDRSQTQDRWLRSTQQRAPLEDGQTGTDGRQMDLDWHLCLTGHRDPPNCNPPECRIKARLPSHCQIIAGTKPLRSKL